MKNKSFATKLIAAFALLLVFTSIFTAASAYKPLIQNGNYPEDNISILPVDNMPMFPELDIVFLIDSTGSMGDEIREVKTHLVKIIKEVRDGNPTPDLRVGIVAYRDHSDEQKSYVSKSFDLTDDIDEAIDFINKLDANGGGDYEEAVDEGLKIAIHKMDWREDAKKLLFLIGDAPPHEELYIQNQNIACVPPNPDWDYEDAVPSCVIPPPSWREYVRDAVDKEIIIYTISASGMNDRGIRIWEDLADETGGEYTHLKYERVDVDQYYEDEGFERDTAVEYAASAKQYSDFDRRSNTIEVNNLAEFATRSVQEEAMDLGVNYDDPDNTRECRGLGHLGYECGIDPFDLDDKDDKDDTTDTDGKDSKCIGMPGYKCGVDPDEPHIDVTPMEEIKAWFEKVLNWIKFW
ncbi:VWA domain-containing protein [Nanoarchaeota archaeon]